MTGTSTVSHDLAELVFHWGSAFRISVSGDEWTARARDGVAATADRSRVTLRADSAAGLREQIRVEYFRLTRIRVLR